MLAELFDKFQNNMSPAMLDFLAEDLGVKRSSLETLGIGFYPAKQAWVFAERNAKGDITGLKYRSLDGIKFYEEGSKSGLTYPFNYGSTTEENKYAAGKAKWIRIADAGVVCPICGKPDWCLVSEDDPRNPSAVLCSRVAEGATTEIPGSGYLHVLDAKRNRVQTTQAALPETDLPILIVEGATDVLAAMDLGFVAIGRPSATGGLKELPQMPLTGRRVWIIGENDAGAGKEGMEKCFIALREKVKGLVRVMPPEDIKDLREWVHHGLTQVELIDYVEQHGKIGSDLDPGVLDSDAPHPIAKRYLDEEYTVDSIPVLRNYKGQWLVWKDNCYVDFPEILLNGSLYRFLDGKQLIKITPSGPTVVLYKATSSKVHDIIHALSDWCPVVGDPPVWLREGGIEPRNLIAFRNGLLDVNEYMVGRVVLHRPDPTLFSMCVFPYNFDPDVTSEVWKNFLRDAFNNDENIIKLLQEWFGYVCTPDTNMEKMMLFTGRPRSGKSTIIEVMTAMLGRNQCVSTDFQSLASQFGRAPLVGKLAATLGDAKTPRAGEADAALETALRIIGRDAIYINPKYRDGFDAYLTVRFTVAMNGLPTFTDYAKALAARTNVISFPNSYVGREDIGLKDRLRREAEQGKLIPWALEGLKRLRKQGQFTVPEQSKTVLGDMISMTSPLCAFVDECCILGEGSETESQMVYETWRRWCTENGHRSGTNVAFSRNLIAECPRLVKEKLQKSEQRGYVYKRLQLQPWVYSKYLGRPN